MKVKVLKYSDSLFWYSKRVGETFKVIRIEKDRVWVRDQGDYGFLNFILLEDYEELKDE